MYTLEYIEKSTEEIKQIKSNSLDWLTSKLAPIRDKVRSVKILKDGKRI